MKDTHYWGATFSHRSAQQFKIDPLDMLRDIISLKFDVLRLCVYWDEVETRQGEVQLQRYHHMLQLCQERGQSVIVTIGMKAPRWPEFHLPSWVPHDPTHPETQRAALAFIERVVTALQKYHNIDCWQIENEALDPSGPDGWVVPESFLVREIELLRSLTDRPTLLTAWGNELKKRRHLPKLHALGADRLGIDLYYHMYHHHRLFGERYLGPNDSDQHLRQEILRLDAPIYITELQAEPWEKDEAQYRSEAPRSMSPSILRSNIQRALQLPVAGVLFWGVEYWLWRAAHGDQRYIEVWKEYQSQRE